MKTATDIGFDLGAPHAGAGSAHRVEFETDADRLTLAKDIALAVVLSLAMFGATAFILFSSFRI
jgi:hypothetical protein